MVDTSRSQKSKLQKISFFNKMEVAELPRVLRPGEEVLCAISGFYAAGTALLCVTSERLLLIDKKMLRLNIEDVRFGAINEVSFVQQLLVASVNMYFSGRMVQFRSWYKHELRILSQYLQSKMYEARMLAQVSVHGGVPMEIDPADQFQIEHTDEPIPTPRPSRFTTTLGRSTHSRSQHLFDRWLRASRYIEKLPQSE